jgi:hypothetical protein
MQMVFYLLVRVSGKFHGLLNENILIFQIFTRHVTLFLPTVALTPCHKSGLSTCLFQRICYSVHALLTIVKKIDNLMRAIAV